MDSIRLVRRELEGKQAVIGFSGAPFTLACYMIEGRPSRDYGTAKSLIWMAVSGGTAPANSATGVIEVTWLL